MIPRRTFIGAVVSFFSGLLSIQPASSKAVCGGPRLRVWVDMRIYLRSLGYRGPIHRGIKVSVNGVSGVENGAFSLDTDEGWVDCIKMKKNADLHAALSKACQSELRRRDRNGMIITRYYGYIETTPSVSQLIGERGEFAYPSFAPDVRTYHYDGQEDVATAPLSRTNVPSRVHSEDLTVQIADDPSRFKHLVMTKAS